MAAFNTTDLRQGRISRELDPSQSKMLIRGIKGIYFGTAAALNAGRHQRGGDPFGEGPLFAAIEAARGGELG